MTTYRFYVIARPRSREPPTDADYSTDAAALDAARVFGETKLQIEVWQGARLVGTVQPEGNG